MFDETKAIAAWRARLAETGTLFEADLDELESHLRDHLEGLEEVGITGESAFQVAPERLGETRALADEFARINPLRRVARGALLDGRWLLHHDCGRPAPLDCLPRGARPGARAAPRQTVHPGARCGRSCSRLRSLAHFAELFLWVRRHQRVPVAWAASPWSRVALLVGGALIALVGRVSYYPLARAEQRFWGHADDYAAIEAWRFATLALAIAAPVGIGVLALWVRAKVSTRSMTLFWVGFGCLVALVSQQLNELVWLALLVGGGVARLGSGLIQGVTWGIALAAPVLSLGSAYLWLRHHLPPPAPLLRSRVSVGMILAITGVAVACYLSMDRIGARAQRLLGMSAYLDAIQAWALASLIVACVMPVAIGGIMLRLRNDSREAETG